MNLTTHFTLEEFNKTSKIEYQEENANKATTFLQSILKVAAELEKPRNFFARKIIIFSGFRCPDLNKAVGGSPNSQHMTGQAADFTMKDFEDPQGLSFVFEWCAKNTDYGQLILETPEGRPAWIHWALPREGKPKTHYYFKNGKYISA